MSFTGREGGQITIDEASQMTLSYRNTSPNQYIAHFFGKDILNQILDQEGCMGIRVYYGVDSDGNKQLVIVGADSDENDMLEIIGDLSHPCPQACSQANRLNS